MSEIKKLNEAMKVLKEECEKHKPCYDCPLFDYKIYPECRVETIPENYRLFEEADQ